MKRLLGLVMAAGLVVVSGCTQSAPPSAATQNAQALTPDHSVVGTAAPAAPKVVTAMPAPSGAAEIIIDDKDPGFTSTGTWNSATGDYYKGEVAWAQKGDTATETATWTAPIPAAGMYAVYEYHGENPSDDHATQAPYTIKYDGGSASVMVDQTKNIDKWNLLGTYKYAAGSKATVTLTNKADGNVIADAVKFVKVK